MTIRRITDFLNLLDKIIHIKNLNPKDFIIQQYFIDFQLQIPQNLKEKELIFLQMIQQSHFKITTGLNHFVRPMFYGSKHAIENISSNSEEIKNYSVVGYICETDTFSENVKLKKTQEGDILCFKNAGAYCFSMSSNYNSRFKPPEVLVSNNEIKLIRKRENFKDLIRNQSN